jgi:hypothetical protein
MSDENERSVAGEPMAWALMQPDSYSVFANRLLAVKQQEICMGGEIIPLYPALTDAEREAIDMFSSLAWTAVNWDVVARRAATLRGLLERTEVRDE